MLPVKLLFGLILIATCCLLLLLVAWCRRLGAQLQALTQISTLDPLTGLPNGRLFEAERWPAALRMSGPLAVLYIDLDQLKEHNDSGGRLIGDRYIVRAAGLLRQACRRGVDPVFRLHTAGDEFVVLLYGDDALYGPTVAKHILSCLLRGGISASIGVATTASAGHRIRAALLAQAEQAMRQAKQAGKGRVIVWQPQTPGSKGPLEAIPEFIDEAEVSKH